MDRDAALDHPCPKGDECALNNGAIHCFACRRNWPRDETWNVPLDQRPIRERDAAYAPGFTREGLWSEDGDRVWLPLDYADDATRVKRLFFAGREIPTCPARDGADYRDLRVKRVFIRPGYPWEEGWAGRGADTWWLAASSRDPNVVEAWEVSYV